jgi:acetylornithine deacetylase/succinyl-diaminopimelate desuccinylase-like protein
VQVFVEGEEEIGSPGLADLLRRHSALLGADFVISTDSGQISEGQGGVLLGLRGMAAFEVEARTLAADVHSGAPPPAPPLGPRRRAARSAAGCSRLLGHGRAGARRCAVGLECCNSQERKRTRSRAAGIYGGSVANSLHAVAEVVAGLHLPNGSVSIPGFYECAAGPHKSLGRPACMECAAAVCTGL